MEPTKIKSEINVELLLKIKEQVLANPEHVDMSSWIVDSSEEGDPRHFRYASGVTEWIGQPAYFASCNTTACIAGWAVILSDSQQLEPGMYIEDIATEDLGLDWRRSKTLFHLEDWPFDFGMRYDRAKSPRERAQVVADRIDHFIATDGEE